MGLAAVWVRQPQPRLPAAWLPSTSEKKRQRPPTHSLSPLSALVRLQPCVALLAGQVPPPVVPRRAPWRP